MKINYLVLHHSAILTTSHFEQFDIINRSHKNRNWGSAKNPVYARKSKLGFYVQYHYFIEPNGEVKMGRTEEEVGWHSGIWKINKSSIAICLGGNFDIELPKKNQEESLKKLLKDLKRKYSNARIGYHRDFKNTHCPGNKIKDDWAKNLLTKKTMKLYIDKNKNQVLGNEDYQFGWSIPDPEKLAEIKEHFKRTGNELGEPIENEMIGWYIIRGTNALGWKQFLNL